LRDTTDMIRDDVQNGHGPLGALYPQVYVSEGDTPAYLNGVANGLRGYEDPGYGGWGGRFEKSGKFENVYIDAVDDGDPWKSLGRWVKDANNDFKVRMDWCVAERFEGARHPPVVSVKGGFDQTIKSGETLILDAWETKSPDGDGIRYRWWQYKEAGSYDGTVRLMHAYTHTTSFVAPKVDKPETIHMIVEAMVHGDPVLKGYGRVVVTVEP